MFTEECYGNNQQEWFSAYLSVSGNFKFSASRRLQGFDVTMLKTLTESVKSLEPQRRSYLTLLLEMLDVLQSEIAWFQPFHHQFVGLARENFVAALSSKWIWLQQFGLSLCGLRPFSSQELL